MNKIANIMITVIITFLLTMLIITIFGTQKENLYKERLELIQERVVLIHKTGWLMGVKAATYDNWCSIQDMNKSYTRDSLQYFNP